VIRLVPSHPGHVGTIAARMRTIDRQECAAFGHTPKRALRNGLMGSLWSVTAKVDGRAEAMFGLVVESAIDGTGTPWMLGTDEIYRHGRALLRIGPECVARCLDSSRDLSNLVSVANLRAVALLRRWGFTIGEDVQMIGGVAFVQFRMTR
jgi:hypothetical protein